MQFFHNFRIRSAIHTDGEKHMVICGPTKSYETQLFFNTSTDVISVKFAHALFAAMYNKFVN